MSENYELERVVQLAKKYRVGRLYLVGSAAKLDSKEFNDYDFAVADMPAGSFFQFYGELIGILPKPVDLINLSGEKSKFSDLIRNEGTILYDNTQG